MAHRQPFLLPTVYVLMTLTFLHVQCTRDNPFDVHANNYISGTKPHVLFVDRHITGYLLDSVKIKVGWSDTARGGGDGEIKKFLIDWDGTGKFSQSVNGNNANPQIISKVFNVRSNFIRIKGIDSDNDTSDVDSAWLEIKRSNPVITSIDAPETVALDSLFTINIKTTDTGGVVTAFYWAVDGKTFSRTTDTGSLSLSFDKTGIKTILVKVRDNKKIESAQKVISIQVTDPKDTTGSITYDKTPPVLVLQSPVFWTDTLYTETVIVSLLARDRSGVAGIYCDKESMKFIPMDSSYSLVKKLQDGLNRFVIRSVDLKGNSRSDTLSVYLLKGAVDTVAPVITVTEPRNLQHISDSVVYIRGTVTDASRIFSVKVNGLKASSSYPFWTALCRLHHGYDTLTVEAVDSSVNRMSSKKSIMVVQNKSPQFTQAPRDTFILLNEKQTFSAEVTDDDSKPVFSLIRSKNTCGTVSSLVTDIMNTSFTYTAVKAGIDTFMLVAKDSWGDKDTAVWRVFVVAPTDSVPVFITDVKTLPETISALDTCKKVVQAQDPQGKKLIYSIVKPVYNGLSIDSLNGKITWIAQLKDTGKHTVTIQVSNGLKTSLLIWNVTVLPRNFPPVFTTPENQVVDEQQKLIVSLDASDQNNDPLEYSFGSVIPTGARLVGNLFTWTPSLSSAGDYNILFVVREVNRIPALSDSVILHIKVNNVNQKPVLVNPGTITGVINKSMVYTLICSDPDSDSIAFSMLNAPKDATLKGNKFSWTPAASDAGTRYVKFIASDGSLSDTISILIRVNNVNGAPVISDPGNKTIDENQLLQFTLDASDPNDDSLKYSVINAPAGAILNGKSFSWRPGYTQSGSYTITFTARDNVLPPLSDSVTITIIVNNVNAPPVLTSPGNRTVTENSNLSFTLSATDADKNIIRYSMNGAPQGATLSGNTFSWTPSFSQADIYKITFYASDNNEPPLLDSQKITIEVKNVNRPPVFTDSSSKSVDENESIQFQLLAYDPDGTEVRYMSKKLPPGATLDMWGIFRWKPSFSQAGTYHVPFIVIDSSSLPVVLRDTVTITIKVNNVNRTPAFTDSSARTIAETNLLSFQLKAKDPDSNTVVYLSNNLPTGATLTSSGLFSWIPKIDAAGVYYISFIARDKSVSSKILDDTVIIRITVSNTSPAIPVLISPVDKAVSQPRSGTFKWHKSINATGYWIQIAKDTLFTKISYQDSSRTVKDTTRNVSGLPNSATCYWRVRALNPGAQSGWSTRQSFKTVNCFSLNISATHGSVTTFPLIGPFDSATVVTLTATPGSGYLFSKWSGDITGTKNPTSVVMNSAKNITAEFILKSFNLTVKTSTGGKVITPADTLPHKVNYEVATTVTAQANTGYVFDKWTIVSGSATIATPANRTTTVTLISEDAVIRAKFVNQ